MDILCLWDASEDKFIIRLRRLGKIFKYEFNSVGVKSKMDY